MKKFAQMINSKIHWIFEADEKPEFAPDIILVDITGVEDIQEGWDYNEETGKFTAPILTVPEPNPTPLDPIQQLIELQAQTVLNTEMLLLQKEIGI